MNAYKSSVLYYLIIVIIQPSKLVAWVRFPSPAPIKKAPENAENQLFSGVFHHF